MVHFSINYFRQNSSSETAKLPAFDTPLVRERVRRAPRRALHSPVPALAGLDSFFDARSRISRRFFRAMTVFFPSPRPKSLRGRTRC